ncbi:MAG TPA: nucleotide exchange factor GrpE [Candidatus Acidoferrales bacterium]|nr:nucleotide exchange factor GrpE [Candidatus Acidoferrales bacterium]
MASNKDKENSKPFVATSGGKLVDRPESAAGDGPAAARALDPQADSGSATEEVQKLLAEKQALMDTLVRRQADFENYRKRVEKERQQDRRRGVELLVEGILPILDAFDRALEARDDPQYAEYRKGFELIRKQLWDLLAKQGVERIEALDKQFDPNLHHAIESVETTEHEEGTVIAELQPGYTFHDRVLRPAMVRVAKDS